MPRGRPKQFDDAEVLERAMELFWEKGYEATSLDDLINTMAIPRQSLYRTFGDKYNLFVRSLRYYDEHVTGKVIAILTTDRPAVDNLRNVFKIWQAGVSSPQRMGCLMVNSGTEDFPKDSEVKQIVKASQLRAVAAFEKTLRRAQSEGGVDASIDPQAVSRTICAAVNGMLAMSRSGVSSAFTNDVFATLPALSGIK